MSLKIDHRFHKPTEYNASALLSMSKHTQGIVLSLGTLCQFGKSTPIKILKELVVGTQRTPKVQISSLRNICKYCLIIFILVSEHWSKTL